MIEKAKVGAKLEAYENELKKEISTIKSKLDEMDHIINQSSTPSELGRAWRNSKEYTELYTKKITLESTLFSIGCVRFDIMKGEN